MATVDYDAPRTNAGTEQDIDSLDLLQERRGAPADPDSSDGYEFSEDDAVGDDYTAPVIPVRADEFRCQSCFLVLHNSLHAGGRTSHDVCRDCA